MGLTRDSEQEQADFVGAMLASALAAEDDAGAVTIPLDIAGVRIDLVFAGSRLIGEILPALRHLLAAGEARPDVRIHIWDSHTTGVRAPPMPCTGDHFTDRGDILGFWSARFRVAFHQDEFSVNAMDMQTGEAVYWVRIADGMPHTSRVAPLRTILYWSLEPRGLHLLRAAAVGDDNGAVLITAEGGVSRSRTALTAVAHGLRFAGDDYLVVRVEPEPAVYSLYNTASFDAADLRRTPTLAPHVVDAPVADGERVVVRLYPAFRSQIMRAMRLRAVLTACVADRVQTRMEPTATADLQRAATSMTLSRLPYAGQQAQSFIEAMVGRLPGFAIHLGSDPDDTVAAIRGLLSRDDATLRAETMPRRPVDPARDPPLVSVIVPTYSGAPFLREAIESVLAQDYPALEIIVVGDSSTDDIEAVVAARPVDVRFVREPDHGPAAARSRGIRDAGGEFIAFLDPDDLWPAGSLRARMAAFERNPSSLVVCGRALILVQNDSGGNDHCDYPAESNPYIVGAALYRRDAFRGSGLFDECIRHSADEDWFDPFVLHGLPIGQLPEVSLFVRRLRGSRTEGVIVRERNPSRFVAGPCVPDRERHAELTGTEADGL